MIEEYGWDIVISVYLVYGLGIGVLIYGLLFVWEHVLDRLMTMFRIKKLFVLFVYDYYRNSDSKHNQMPDMKFEKRAEIKSRLSREKEDDE